MGLFVFHPVFHGLGFTHQGLHLLHGFEVGGVGLVKHVHAVLFALLGDVFESFGVELVAAGTGSAELVTGHRFHRDPFFY